MAPKKYAVDFTAWGQPFKLEEAVICKDWVSEAVEHARRVGVKGILFVANISKALQLTGGLISLGADEMDIRMQALIAHGALHGISSETARALSRCINTEEGLELLREAGLLELTMTSVMDTLKKRFDEKSGENMRAEILVYSAQYGILGQTEGFQWLFDKMRQPAS